MTRRFLRQRRFTSSVVSGPAIDASEIQRPRYGIVATHRHVRADLAAERAVRVRGDLRDDLRAEDVLRELDRRDAEPALAAVDEERLAPADLADELQVEVGRRVDLGDAGGLGEREAPRHRHHHPLRHDDLLRVAAAPEERADAVADLEALVCRALQDLARALEPRPVRPALRRRIDALALHQVRAVERTRPNTYLHIKLGMAGRSRHVPPHEVPGFINTHCLHGANYTIPHIESICLPNYKFMSNQIIEFATEPSV